MKTKIKNAVKKFKNSKFFLGMICLVIGASGMFIYVEGQDYYDWLQEGLSYTYKEVVVKDVGVSVEIHPEMEAHDTLSEEREVLLPSPNIEDKIREVFGNEADNAIRVCKCESQMHPDKIGDKQMAKWSYGLFQINRTWHDYSPETLLNADENIKIAKQIYDRGGWGRWTCAKIVGII